MFWHLLTSFLTTSVARAQAAAPAAPAEQPWFMTLVPFVFMFAVLYFLIIRPQSKRQRDQQKFLSELKRGDEVITSGGILGRIEGITDQFVTLDIADGVRIKILRSQIAASGKVTGQNEKKG